MSIAYFVCFFCSFVICIFSTKLAIILSEIFNIYDLPERRKIHRRPVPRLGGLGLFIAWFISVVLTCTLFPEIRKILSETPELPYKSSILGIPTIKTQLVGILIGTTLVLALGIADDKKSVKAVTKLLVQIIAAYCAMDFGVRILGLNLPSVLGGYYSFSILLSQITTVIWLIGFMNSINLIDGLDGLAAGIVGIASGSFFVISLLQIRLKEMVFMHSQLTLSAILSVALCGVCISFLLYNFSPAKVFMGDSGSLFLGFALGSISIIGILKMAAIIGIVIPIIIVALPILDTLLAIFRRLRRGEEITHPDKEHLHHRLLRFGWTQREIVLLMYVITLVLSIFAIVIAVYK